MKHTSEIKLINELIDISKNIPSFIPTEASYRSFGGGEYNISFLGDQDINKFNNYSEKIYYNYIEINDFFTLKTFEKKLIELIRKIKAESRQAVELDFDRFLKSLNTIDIIESEILFELYGAKMNKDSIKFGEFTIYNYPLAQKELIKKYPVLINNDLFFSRRKSDYFIGIKVKAKENAKASEKAKKLCETFENVFNFMIADLEHKFSIGIFNYRGWKTTSAIICNNTSTGFSVKNYIVELVDIQDKFFKDKNQGNDVVWNLLTKKNKSELEKRILNSIEWVGKAVYDLDLSKSLVQFVFGIEGMLQFNEKTLITPSIISQMSDWLAFIIADNVEERKKISKYFKETYQKRSAIAHGADKKIEISDLMTALNISKRMVISFLVKEPFCKFERIDELNQYIIDLKYS